MTPAYRNSPAANGAESENISAGNRGTSDSTAVRSYPARIVLSDEAEQYLEHLAVDVCLGRVNLWQFSPALLALYTVGHEQGRASRDEYVRRLERDCDRLHFIAYNRGKTGADWMRGQTAELWRQGSEGVAA